MLTESEKEIVDLYESGVGVEAIGGELDMTGDEVKLVLTNHSRIFQLELGKKLEDTGVATEDERREFISSLKHLALYAENESVRARCAIYLHEEVIGRNERRIKQVENGDNKLIAKVLMINEGIAKAREIMNRVKNGSNKIVDIQSETPGPSQEDKQLQIA